MVDEAVNSLMRDDATPVLAAQFAGDLLGRPACYQALAHVLAQLGIAGQLEARIPASSSLFERLGSHRLVALGPSLGWSAIALELAANRAGRAFQSPGNCPHRAALLAHSV